MMSAPLMKASSRGRERVERGAQGTFGEEGRDCAKEARFAEISDEIKIFRSSSKESLTPRCAIPS